MYLTRLQGVLSNYNEKCVCVHFVYIFIWAWLHSWIKENCTRIYESCIPFHSIPLLGFDFQQYTLIKSGGVSSCFYYTYQSTHWAFRTRESSESQITIRPLFEAIRGQPLSGIRQGQYTSVTLELLVHYTVSYRWSWKTL